MEPTKEVTPRTTRQMADVSTTCAILVVCFDWMCSRIAITRARSANNAAQKNDSPAANPVLSNPKCKRLKRPTPIITKTKTTVNAADKTESVRARVNVVTPSDAACEATSIDAANGSQARRPAVPASPSGTISRIRARRCTRNRAARGKGCAGISRWSVGWDRSSAAPFFSLSVSLIL